MIALGPVFAESRAALDPWLPVTTFTNAKPRRTYSVRLWTTSDGLPMNKVQALLQTRDGCIWVGTQGGLAKFDGHRLVPFTGANTPAFKKDSCLALAEGLDGTLWVGTTAGIVCFRSNRFERIDVPYPHRDGEWVNGIAVANDGTVWASNLVQGPGRIEHDKLVFDPSFEPYDYNGRSTREALAIAVDSDGVPLLSTRVGILRRKNPEGPWERVYHQPALKMFSAPDRSVWAVEPSLFRVATAPVEHRVVVGGNAVGDFRAATCNSEGAIIAAVENRLYVLEDSFKEVPLAQPLAGEVTALLVDLRGNIWVGCTRGLACLSRSPVSLLTTAEGLTHDDVWSISPAPDGTIWIGSSSGVSRYDERSELIERYIPRGDGFARRVQAILAVSDGTIWMSMNGTLCRFTSGITEILRDENDLPIPLGRPLYEEKDGSVWATVGGYPKRWCASVMEGIIEPGEDAMSILRDAVGRLWIGTRGAGLLVVDGNSTNRLTITNGLTSNFCGAVLAEEDGTVWIVSNKGLNRWKEGRITQYTVEDGLHEGTVLNLLDDQLGYFWLNGHRGIYRVSRQQLNDFAEGRISRLAVLHFTEAHGLPSAQGNGGWLPNSCRSPDGRLWFPTTRGVAIIDPTEIGGKSAPAAAMITGISVDREVVFGDGTGLRSLTTKLLLEPGRAREMLFDFASPGFSPGAQIRFEYQLENQDPGWVSTGGDRFALYTNLRPGDYRFRVRAVSAEGVPGTPAEFAFALAPHIHQRKSFYVACAALLAIVAGVVHTRRIATQRRIDGLEQQNALERERSRIAADIHDLLGADLSRIALLSQRLSNGEAKPEAAAISQTIRGMGKNMSGLIWATNSRNDTLDDLLAYVREQAATMCEAAGLELISDIPNVPARYVSGFLRHNVFLIVCEALHNAVKHSGARTVRLRAALEDDALIVEVQDDGRGFDPLDTALWGNGQPNMRKRAVEIRAEFRLVSDAKNGTALRLRVPLERPPEHFRPNRRPWTPQGGSTGLKA